MRRPFTFRRSLIARVAALAIAPAIAPSTRAAQVTIPATRAGALQWIVDQLNSGGKGFKSRRDASLMPVHLSELDEQRLIDTFAAMNPIVAPVTIARVEGGITDQHANDCFSPTRGTGASISSLEFNDPYLIDTFYFDTVTVPDTPDKPKSWGGMKPFFESIAPGSAFIAGEIINGEFSQISEYNSDEEFPIASSFKLFVLGAMATQVAAGEHAWSETVTISTIYGACHQASLYYEPAGSTYPLEYIVERMTAESDNTATDHTIFTANRNRVELELGRLGHSRPNMMTPLMYTREWFAMRIHFDDDQVSRHVNATTAERRSILEHTVDPLADTPQEWTNGRDQPTVTRSSGSPASAISLMSTRLQGFAASEPTAVVGNALSLFRVSSSIRPIGPSSDLGEGMKPASRRTGCCNAPMAAGSCWWVSSTISNRKSTANSSTCL